ncbi:exodeoxyribonuclease V subunit beta [Alteromonadaceae bacterium BrNp21-10]|nr:exodeoxyribonuclease V subunit beta [Alteromonadaceae bacterium BrNp21-10]
MSTPLMQNLQIDTLALSGRHIIEASAGTGKTYNITKLYLRLLLEKQLEVQQILVVTFTKAATEELRGRIALEIRQALADAEQQRHHRHKELLQKALLHMDESAIFTIHGFCKRALEQQAYLSGIPPEAELEVDCTHMLMDAVRDWLRSLSAAQLSLLPQKSPQKFFENYRDALQSALVINPPLSAEQANQRAQQLKQQLAEELVPYHLCIEQVLIADAHGSANRARQWQAILQWLDDDNIQFSSIEKELTSFFNSMRTKALKSADDELLAQAQWLMQSKVLAECLKALASLQKLAQQVPATDLLVNGINHIRQQFSQCKRAATKLDVNDLVELLAQQMLSDESAPLVAALREQYPLAMVDEFQDTDAHQYAIFDHLYPASREDCGLFMIGDPKQAIYRFRGGDIFTYLRARQSADYHWQMDTNWRSTPNMIAAYNRLFRGQPTAQNDDASSTYLSVFGQGIDYTLIHHPDNNNLKHNDSDIQDPDTEMAALNVLIDDPALHIESGEDDASKKLSADDKTASKQRVVDWMVAEISRLLATVKINEQPLQARDIAILVPKQKFATMVQDSLRAIGLQSVYLSNRESVFDSPEALELKLVMQGILDHGDDRKLIAALSTRLFGGDVQRLHDLQQVENDGQWQYQRDYLANLLQQWQSVGFLPMAMGLVHQHYQPEPHRHERALTNMLHLLELLQKAAQQFRYPAQLLNWFDEQISLHNRVEIAEQRLESEADLIKISTLHGSKGLEYPFVFVPFASDYSDPIKFGNTTRSCLKYFDGDANEYRFSVQGDANVHHCVKAEDNAEKVRLLYVAITRAIYRCYVGVALEDTQIENSPLGLACQVTDKSQISPRLLAMTQQQPNIELFYSDNLPQQHRPPTAEITADELAVAECQRDLSSHWRINSFSGISRFAQQARLVDQRLDEKQRNDVSLLDDIALAQAEQLRFTLAKGVHTGNLLHDSLEHMDFQQWQDASKWQQALMHPMLAYGDDSLEVESLQAWLSECLQTSLPALGESEESLRLCDLSLQQTCRESEFYFALNTSSAEMGVTPLAQFLMHYRQDLRLATQADIAEQQVSLPDNLQGMMHGYIDLIFEHQGRYFVADYKSTHLGSQYENYHHQALQTDMQTHFYDLQYLIYLVALHRHLQATLADYDPEQHLGGIYYLYLRGMHPEQSTGVYAQSVAVEDILQLDSLLSVEEVNAHVR